MARNPPVTQVDRYPAEPTRFSNLADAETLLLWAKERGASDIVLLSGEPVNIRLHGEWFPVTKRRLQVGELHELLGSMAREDSAAAQVQSGKDYDFAFEFTQRNSTIRHRFRCNATACRHGYQVGMEIVVRTIPEIPPSLDELGLESDPGLIEALFPRFGLVIVTGPVGSGKTTFLAATLREILTTPPGRHILTYEAPIEFDLTTIPDRRGIVIQSEVPQHLPSFNAAPRNSLRRAGDVVLYGEVRDTETIRNMTTQTETGVAVYCTAHTNSVSETISRMVREFPWQERDGIQAALIAALRLIVHQRLLPSEDGTRVAVREYLPFNESIRRTLIDTSTQSLIPTCQRLVEAHGRTLIDDIRAKHAEGRISSEEMEQMAALYRRQHEHPTEQSAERANVD